jgi:hypothetical protein
MRIIAYFSEYRNVLWCDSGPNALELSESEDSIGYALQDYITKGHVMEILETQPWDYGTGTGPMHQQCIWWRNHLREQGYDMIKETGAEQ